MATRLPEWFIGGPMHGTDKVAKFGNDTAAVFYVMQPAEPVAFEPVAFDRQVEDRIAYVRQRTGFGSAPLLTIWVADGVDQQEISILFAELLLAPHAIPV
jgi:hypothetical protein